MRCPCPGSPGVDPGSPRHPPSLPWSSFRGGVGEHVLEPDVWRAKTPVTNPLPHVFLKAGDEFVGLVTHGGSQLGVLKDDEEVQTLVAEGFLEPDRRSVTRRPLSTGDLQLLLFGSGFGATQGLDFLELLTNSTRLNFLAIDFNLLEGTIPKSIGNLSKALTMLYMGGNEIYGTIPSSIGELKALGLLNLSYTSISGEIPSEVGLLQELRVLFNI